MTVHVVMGNDFPDSVWDDEAKAEAYCEQKMEAQKCTCGKPWAMHHDPSCPKSKQPRTIYFRVYPFEVQS